MGLDLFFVCVAARTLLTPVAPQSSADGAFGRELADRSGCSPDTVRRFVELGVLGRGAEAEPFEVADVHRVRLMQALEASGVDLELIARGSATGEVSYENLGLYLPDPAAFAQSFAELAGETGRSADFLHRLVGDFGLPQPSEESRLREDDACMLADFLAVWDSADDEVLARLARTSGENLRRVVVSELQLASTALLSRIRELESTPEGRRRLVTEMGTQVMDLSERLLVWLRRRHLEHEIYSFIVGTTEDYLQELGWAPKRGQPPAAIAFLDLTGYTALTEEWGDYFGRTVNVAARIADYARPGEVLVSGEVNEGTNVEGVDFREIGPVTLKGLKGEVALFSAARAAASR
ncbi:MAG: adenylate/guanylate cyclase domain-containing protein [Gaiellaceae bacterium]